MVKRIISIYPSTRLITGAFLCLNKKKPRKFSGFSSKYGTRLFHQDFNLNDNRTQKNSLVIPVSNVNIRVPKKNVSAHRYMEWSS